MPRTQNISSNELERDEIHEIAAEIKDQLDSPKADAGQPKPTEPPEAKPAKVTEHSIDLQSESDDTIFIDRDGSFHAKPTAQ
jgi:hypothetical protein